MSEAQCNPTPDFTEMNPVEMVQMCADDAHLWATAYCQFFPEADHGALWSWFANAIEVSWEHRIKRLSLSYPETTNPTLEIQPPKTGS